MKKNTSSNVYQIQSNSKSFEFYETIRLIWLIKLHLSMSDLAQRVALTAPAPRRHHLCGKGVSATARSAPDGESTHRSKAIFKKSRSTSQQNISRICCMSLNAPSLLSSSPLYVINVTTTLKKKAPFHQISHKPTRSHVFIVAVES